MKASLTLQAGQQLTMTPQLQQAIRLLQLSSLELQQEIQLALESNPLLELDEDPYQDNSSLETELLNGDEDSLQSDQHDWAEHDLDTTPPEQQDIPEKLFNDTDWQDIYPTTYSTANTGDNPHSAERSFETRHSTESSLEQHLLTQIQLLPLSSRDQLIGYCLINSLDTDGLMRDSLTDIGQQCALLLNTTFQPSTSSETKQSTSLSGSLCLDEIEAVLHLIQRLDPPGVAATSLSECILRQLEQLPADTYGRAAALSLCDFGLDSITQLPLAQLGKKAELTQNELSKAMSLIRSLRHAPADAINPSHANYITPDITVSRYNNEWITLLNRDHIPKLRVHRYYQSLNQNTQQEADAQYLKSHLAEAKWLLKSLESRNDTLLRVAKEIVELQRPFFDYGPEAMKPLVLHDIAERVGMHDSTISRVTSNKYLTCPQGTFELKYFFSSHVTTDIGGSCSATAIRAMIKRLVKGEPPEKPLSDSKLAALLEAQGIQVARRTVAKYREAINIPPSKERKRAL